MSESKSRAIPLHPRMIKAKEVFAVRYFEWAVAQAKSEAQAGFPNLREIEAPAVFHFLEFYEENHADVSHRMLDILVRAGHPYAMALKNNSLTSSELLLLRRYSGSETESGNRGAMTGLQTQRYTRNMQTKFAECISEVDREKIISSIATRFSDLGGVCRRDIGSLEHVQRLGGWHITTHFAALTSGPTKLAYEHRISPFPYGEGAVTFYLGRTERPSHGISILDWLGIWPVTNWMSLPKGSPEEIGFKVATMAELFVGQAPKLLEGLEASSQH